MSRCLKLSKYVKIFNIQIKIFYNFKPILNQF